MSSNRQDRSPKGSSKKPSLDEPAFIDPTDDATFQSLKRLLSAPATSTQHLSLLSSETLFGSITYYLSKLEIDHVAEFAGILSSSGCLWTPPPPNRQVQQPQSSESSSDTQKVTWSTDPKGKSAAPKSEAVQPTSSISSPPVEATLSSFLIARSTSLSHALAAAIARRTRLVVDSRKGSAGWGSRRALMTWITNVISGMTSAEANGPPESYKASRGLPIPRLAILTGLMQGLYLLIDERKRRRRMSFLEDLAATRSNPSLKLSVKHHASHVEDEWVVAFAEILESLAGGEADASENKGETDGGEELDEWETEFRKRTAELAASAQITSLSSKAARLAAVREIQDVPLFLAAQLAPFLPDAKVQALNTEHLAAITSDAILSLFEASSEGSSVLEHLAADAYVGPDGKAALKSPSQTIERCRTITQSTLFPSLGPLSKLLSRALAHEVTLKDPESLALLVLNGPAGSRTLTNPILQRMLQLAEALESAWLSSALAGVKEEDIVPESRQYTAQLWTVFKSVLFSYTMVFDSMLDSLVDMCPSPTTTFPPAQVSHVEGEATRRWPPASTSNLPPVYLLIVQSMLRTYSKLYWITSTFGSDGFDVYRKVFYSAIDVIGRDGEACIALLEEIRPDASAFLNGTSSGEVVERQSLEHNTAKRSGITYFLNVAEQIVPVLPDEVVEQMLLPFCRPYLEDTRFKDAFESAHSVALAVYTSRKRCMMDLTPFYIDLLLNSFPSLLNSTQLEYAFTTIVSALSDRSDSVTWWTIQRLAEEIQKEGASNKDGAAAKLESSLETATEPSQEELSEAQSSSQSVHPSNPAVADGGAVTPVPIEGDEPLPQDRYVALQLCLLACIPCVNLVLLRSILNKAEVYILEHKARANEQSKKHDSHATKMALAERTFDSIQGLNSATREEGLRWWLDKRASFGV